MILFGVTLIFFFGYFLSIVLVEDLGLIERCGLAFLLGFGVFTLLMFGYSTLGIRITFGSTLFALVVCILTLFLIIRLLKRKVDLKLPVLIKTLMEATFFDKLLTAAIAAVGIGSLTLTSYFPVYIWDALAIYDFRGKVIADVGFYTQIAKNFFWFDGYPLFTSLSHTLVYLFKGTNPQFLYSLLFTAFLFTFYGLLRRFVDRTPALIAVLLLATTPLLFQHSTFAYTNLPYTVFLCLGSIYLYVWLVDKKHLGYVVLSAVLTGLATWTRSTEPFWVVNILLLFGATLLRFKKHFPAFGIYVLTFFTLREPWNIVSRYISSKDDNYAKGVQVGKELISYGTTLSRTPFDITRFAEVAKYIYENVIVSWSPVVFVFLFCIVLNAKALHKKSSSLFLVLTSLYFGILLYGTYVYTFGPTSWREIPDSARRMAMFFMPLMLYYIGLVLGSLYDKKSSYPTRK